MNGGRTKETIIPVYSAYYMPSLQVPWQCRRRRAPARCSAPCTAQRSCPCCAAASQGKDAVFKKVKDRGTAWENARKRTETNGKGSGLPAAVGSQSPPAASGRPGCLAARKCNNTCQSLKSLNRKSLNPQPHTLRFQMEAMLMPRGDGRGRAAERLSCRHWRCAPPALRWQQQHHNERR